jgi:hypothetical protein
VVAVFHRQYKARPISYLFLSFQQWIGTFSRTCNKPVGRRAAIRPVKRSPVLYSLACGFFPLKTAGFNASITYSAELKRPSAELIIIYYSAAYE